MPIVTENLVKEPCPTVFRDSRIVAVDIETTGLNIRFNTIIELGFIEYTNCVQSRAGTQLFAGGHSPLYLVRQVHRIPDRDRRGLFRKRFEECAEHVHDLLEDAVVVTHNGNAFDLPMIQSKLSAAGWPVKKFRSIDTLQLARKWRKSQGDADDDDRRGRNRLGSLCAEFGVQYGGESGDRAHHGLEDAAACLGLLFKMVNTGAVILPRL